MSGVRKVAKLVWAAPCSIVGLAFALVALLLGGSAKRASGTLEVTLAHSEAARPRLSRLLPFRAIALGHVIIAVGRQELEDLRAHELIHVQQYERWGIAFLLAYAASSVCQLLHGRSAYWNNHFEVQARLLSGESAREQRGANPSIEGTSNIKLRLLRPPLMSNATRSETSLMDRHYVYLISCRGEDKVYVKIGLSSSIQRRLSNIQTGCPHPITHAFVVRSKYREEVEGLERLLHILLEPERLRAEWYEGSSSFFETLDAVLSRINSGRFSYKELLAMPDFVGPEFEIMMHRHGFQFLQISLPVRKGVNPIKNTQRTSPAQIAELLLRDAPNPSIEGTPHNIKLRLLSPAPHVKR